MRLLLVAVVAASVAGCATPALEPPVRDIASVDFPMMARLPGDERLVAAAMRDDGAAVRRLVAEGAAPNCGTIETLAGSEGDRTPVVRRWPHSCADVPPWHRFPQRIHTRMGAPGATPRT